MIDIIIPVHNRPEHTQQTINSLMETGDRGLFQLYVIDDGSAEETKNLLAKLSTMYHFHLKRNDAPQGPAASRNAMCDYINARTQRGDLLYHSDNDVYFKPHAIKIMLDIFSRVRDHFLVLGGGCHPYLQSSNKIECMVDGQRFEVGTKDAVSGYSQLMSWETWLKYGPFSDANRNEIIKIMGSEDWAFCQKIVKDGYLVGAIEPEVVIATGKTNTYGSPATGSETFKEVDGVKIL